MSVLRASYLQVGQREDRGAPAVHTIYVAFQVDVYDFVNLRRALQFAVAIIFPFKEIFLEQNASIRHDNIDLAMLLYREVK
jgi:hypothetical protein